MPQGFDFPREAELWLRAERDLPEIPLPNPVDLRQLRDARHLAVLGRLRPRSDARDGAKRDGPSGRAARA